MRKLVLAVLIAAAAALVSTPAFAADTITHLTSARLSSILKEAGATDIQTSKPEEGVEIVTFNDGTGGVNFVLMECEAQGCPVLQMAIFFDPDPRFTLAAVNSFNAEFLNAQAAIMKDNRAALMRLFLTGGGVTEDNLKVNMMVFLQAPALFETHLASQVTAALDKQGAQPVVAAPEPSGLKIGVETQMKPVGAGKIDILKWLDKSKTNRRLH